MRFKNLLGVGALVAVIAIAGSAFTASNTMPASGGTAGFGSVTASGITLTGVDYVVSLTDGSKIDQVLFTTTTDPGAAEGTLSIKDGGGTLVVASQDCGAAVSDGDLVSPTWTFTCDPTTDPAALDVVTVGFTATEAGA